MTELSESPRPLLCEVFLFYLIYLYDMKIIITESQIKRLSINENIYKDMGGDNFSNYMENVLKNLVGKTIIEEGYNGDVMISVPFSDLQYNRIRHFNVGFFIDYCKITYGLSRKESEYIWGDYLNEIDYILKYEFGIKDPVYH